MPPKIDRGRCDACGLCVEYCPGDIFTRVPGGAEVAWPDECWHCLACVDDCPQGAIEVQLPLGLY